MSTLGEDTVSMTGMHSGRLLGFIASPQNVESIIEEFGSSMYRHLTIMIAHYLSERLGNIS